MLRTRQLIPPLTIRTPAGRTVQAWDYKQKKNLVIAFVQADCPGCEEFLRQLISRTTDLKEHEAVALVVYSQAPPVAFAEPLPPEIMVGADMGGRSLRAYVGDETASAAGPGTRGVFVADRYGELYAQWLVRREHQFPGIGEVVSWLEQIEVACEECGASHWPAESSTDPR